MKSVVEYKKFSSFLELRDYAEIPDIQRDLIFLTLFDIEKYIEDCLSNTKEPILGTLDLVRVGSVNKLYISDGQHRFFAIKNMYDKKGILFPIHTLIYNVESYDELVEIYKFRNATVQVPDYYLNISKDIMDKRELLKEINRFLSGIILFKISGNTRPYVNIYNFIDSFTKSKLYREINTIKEFEKLFHIINNECENYVMSLNDKQIKHRGLSNKMLNSFSDNGNYIGYDLNFPYFQDSYDISRILEQFHKK